MHSPLRPLVLGLLLTAVPAFAVAQHEGMDHTTHAAAPGAKLPTLAGQDAYGAMAEIVRLLEADSTTDWSRVNLERLRLHLIAMNEVTLNASIEQALVPAGLQMVVTGTGRTLAAIRSMARAHVAELNRMPQWRAEVEDTPSGMRMTVTAARPSDLGVVNRIRALGFIGLLTVDNHHAPHHLALARGVPMAGHE